MILTPSSRPRRAADGTPRGNNLNSDGGHLSLPPSSAPNLSAREEPEEPDEIRAIWGTTVNINETIRIFKDFLRGFKLKYRVAYDRERGVRTRTLASPEDGEICLYETLMRRMRQTGETNLNLDMHNLSAYPPAKKLYSHLHKYPQEVIPSMDQALKDIMLELAQEDHEHGIEGMGGEQGQEELGDIWGKVYKIRPFGLSAINLRDLNPTGKHYLTLAHTNV